MKEKIKIGVIGTGFARLTQIPAFVNCEDTEVVSIASASLTNAEKTAADFGIEHATDNWRETVRREDIDLISITTPPNLHHEMTLFAIEHNKHILCEKPMAMNASEAKEMTDKAKDNLKAASEYLMNILTKDNLKKEDFLAAVNCDCEIGTE